MGRALMGTGRGCGERRAIDAAQQAISSPLLEDVSIDGATGILINITGGPDLTLFEVNEASTLIQEAAHEDANIIFGSVIDANFGDEVRITVIATGFDRVGAHRSRTASRASADRAQARHADRDAVHGHACGRAPACAADVAVPRHAPQVEMTHAQAHARQSTRPDRPRHGAAAP